METEFYVRTTNGDTSSVRKLSNEVAKKKFIDLDGGIMDLSLGRRLSIDRKSSQGSDSLWADVRKLSEAGIRRASDSSIVLTEDTDSFIIGDRVWVGGTKPGQIAYIGETQFAPGDWAGIVLDEPIGKNDGSVAGIRYFQCENRKGIFSRLTRLSRKPLMTNEDGQVTPLASPPGTTTVSPGSSVSRITSPASPTGSITMPVTHTSSRGGSELKVGDRVIVMNSNAGSKAGMLRFIGTTQFAPGEWCGVELDDPLGKNDGTVQGVRYFECQDKFGLFAPLHKVSLSPSSSRRPSCAMHHGLKRFGSKESISSVASTASVRSTARKPPSHSATSTPIGPKRTPLQDIIKEKDIYIEQLLKERDMEKSEGIFAASRIEAAEHKFDVLNQEYVQYREEVEARHIDMQAFVSHLQDQNKELASQLEDERKRSEDLQFRFEEESINKSEIEVSNQSMEDKIADLEQLLQSERARIEDLERESNKLFEAEEMIAMLRVMQEERDDKLSHLQASSDVTDKLVEELKEQMDLLNTKLEETLSLNRKQEDEIMKLTSMLENSKVLTAQKQDELTLKYTIETEKLNKKLAEYESKIKGNELKEENLIKVLNDVKASSLKQTEELKECHEQELERLRNLLTESEQSKKNIEDSSKMSNSELESISDLLKKEKLEASAKVEGLTQQLHKLEETCNRKEEEVTSLDEKLSKLQILIQVKDEENKAIKESAFASETNLKKEVEQLLNEIKTKEKEFVDKIEEEKKLIGDSTSAFKELELKTKNEIEQVSLKLSEKEAALKDVQSNMELKQIEFNNTLQEKEESYKQLKSDFENTKVNVTSQIDNLNKELSASQNAVKESEVKLSKLVKDLEDQKSLSLQSSEELKKCHAQELEKLQQLLTETELKAENYENCFKSENTEFSEIKAMLKKENEDAKSKILNLEKEIILFKEKCIKKEEEITGFQQKLSEMENSIKEKAEENENFKKITNDSETSLKKQVEDLENKIKYNKSEFELKEEFLHSELVEMKNVLEKTQTESLHYKNISNDFETQTKELKDKMDLIVEENESKMNSLNNVFEHKKEEFELIVKEKNEKISELERNSQVIIGKQEELNSRCSDYESQFKEKDVVIENLRKELEQSRVFTVNLKKELDESKIMALSSSEEVKTHFTNEIENLGKMLTDSEIKAKNYENDLEGRKKEIDDLRMAFQKENEDHLNKFTELEKQLNLSKDGRDNKEKEILNLTEKVSEMENTIKLKNEEVFDLKETSVKIENDFKKEIENIQNQLKLKENEFKSSENMLTTTVNDLKASIEEGKIKFTELETKNKQLEMDLKENINQVDIQVKEKDKLSSMLSGLESNKTDHDKLLKEEQGKFINMKNDLEKSKLEMVEQHKVLQDLRQRLAENDQRFNAQRELIAQKEQDMFLLKTNSETNQKKIASLTSEIADWKNKLKTSEENCSLLNQQKLKIEKDLGSLRKSVSSNSADLQQTSVTNQQISNGNDEDINYQMQIDFMNSIIVGLQHEKEALNARIHYLETGELSGATNGNGNEHKALRMYCDICEVFDAHETEECPRQAMDSPPPQQAHKPLPRGYQRPYCENCETFGHLTGDCEDLTF